MIHARADYDPIQDPRADGIPDDEPVFLIRAQDVLGPDAVHGWAKLAEREGVDPVIVRGVRAHAARMLEWQSENRDRVKVPDVPAGAMR